MVRENEEYFCVQMLREINYTYGNFWTAKKDTCVGNLASRTGHTSRAWYMDNWGRQIGLNPSQYIGTYNGCKEAHSFHSKKTRKQPHGTRVSTLLHPNQAEWNINSVWQWATPTKLKAINCFPLKMDKTRFEYIWSYTPSGEPKVASVYKQIKYSEARGR